MKELESKKAELERFVEEHAEINPFALKLVVHDANKLIEYAKDCDYQSLLYRYGKMCSSTRLLEQEFHGAGQSERIGIILEFERATVREVSNMLTTDCGCR